MEVEQAMSHPSRIGVRTTIANIARILRITREADPVILYVSLPLKIVSTLLGYLAIWLSALFINRLTAGEYTTIYDQDLLYLAIGYVTIPILSSYLSDIYSHRFDQFYNKFTQYIEIQFLQSQARIDIQTHEDSDFNNLKIEALENAYRLYNYSQAIFGLSVSIVAASISFLLLAQYNLWIAIVVLLAFVPQFAAQMYVGDRVWAIWGGRAELRRLYVEYRQYFQKISNLTEMKLNGSGAYWVNKVREVLETFNGEIRSNETLRFLLQSISTICMVALVGAVTFLLMSDVVAGSLAIGTFIFLESQILAVRNQISDSVYSVTGFMTNNLFVTDIFKYFDTAPALKNGTYELSPHAPSIEFKNVSFKYPGTDAYVVKNISLLIPGGAKVALVGVNGAGKSTFTKLLMRFYDPTEGEILVDGQSLKDMRIETWHRIIGYLPQDYANYYLPIREAIAVGQPDKEIDPRAVEEAARKSGADAFICKWQKQYETQLGRQFDGEEPSIGQWQKLALSRIFYKKPHVWILDEPTSSIDAVAELEVFRELESLSKDTTALFITHRFNTVRNADIIIVIENGRIAERGSHDELMQAGAIYATLFTAQRNSFETSLVL